MKKHYALMVLTLCLALTLIACSKTPTNQPAAPQANVATGPSQSELNEKLKKEAIKAEFIQLNSHSEQHLNKSVFIEGAVMPASINGNGVGQTFTVTTKEGVSNGVYAITNLSRVYDVKDNSKVKVYGTFTGKDTKLDMPTIVATIVEIVP